jgi:hypothetical protein
MARRPSRPSIAVVRTVAPARILRDADDRLVDLEEVHADAAPRVRGERTGAQADHADVAEAPVR